MNDIVNIFNQLSRALFNKYSSSQDYLFGQVIEKFIQNKTEPMIINFKDGICLTENEEHFRKIYHNQNINSKLDYLSEYYKFHKEVPRVFISPVYKCLNCNLLIKIITTRLEKLNIIKSKECFINRKEQIPLMK